MISPKWLKIELNRMTGQRETCGISLHGWRRNGVAFVLGAMMTLTLAPFFAFPFIIPSFTGLYLLVNNAPTPKRRFADGWWWGWGFYMTSLYWICIALLTDVAAFGWLIPFALFGLTAVIALYAGVAAWLMSWVRAPGITRLVAFSLVWTWVEVARGHWFTGFPWNLAGYSFGFSLASMQMASVIGVYGLTFLAVLLGTSLAALTLPYGKIYLAGVWAAFAGMLAWGNARIPADIAYVDGVTMRLVQANIAQEHKWDPKQQIEGVKEYVRLTMSPSAQPVTHVIWPETAVPYILESGSALARMLGDALPPQATLITGTLRSEGEREHFQIWNSLVALNHYGKLISKYDKIHLVPFGEFQPVRPYVPREWMTPVGDTDFSSGVSTGLLQVPDMPAILPLICYEAIFPEMSFSGEVRAGMLLTVTNDAWFGRSIGPHQHFQMARMRAVEQGLPLVRVANTGISGVVDAYGRVTAQLPLGVAGVLDTRLPQALPVATVYGSLGSVIMGMLGGIFAVIMLFYNWMAGKEQKL